MYIVHTMKLLQNNRIHPILDNERFNLLAFTLDEQTYKTTMIQFPPEMDENWVRYGLAKLGQISR